MRNQAVRLLFDNLDEKKANGSILRKPGSSKLYILFYYMGRRVEKSTGIDDTPANRRKVRGWLDNQAEKMEKGTFNFAEAFPTASGEEKRWFATKEGWEYNPEPGQVLFGDYLDKWAKDILAGYDSEGKKDDYKRVIAAWISPYFKDLSFHQINGVEIQKFLRQLNHKKGNRAGQPLSGSRVRNIMIPLRAIWSDACEEHRWDLPDPFRFVGRHLPKKRKKHPAAFRFAEWQRVVDCIEPYYRPIAEVMVMTGLIASEIAGLRKTDLEGGKLHIRNSIVDGREQKRLKTEYRIRTIPVTDALGKLLEEAATRSLGPYFFMMENGTLFDGYYFRRYVWAKALSRAGMNYRVPYTVRHTFAAWALAAGIHPNKLIRLMGHGSKQMVYEVYGNYVDGLEADKDAITGYFGPDFLGT